MKKVYLVFLFCCLSIAGFGQTAASYSFAASSSTFADISGTSLSIIGDDYTVVSIPLNFTFNFCGVNYTSVGICSNGWLSFSTSLTASTSSSTNYDNSSLANLPTPAVMGYWDDLINRASSSATYTTTGSSGSKIFTVEWKNFGYNAAGAAKLLSFEIKLFESTNTIQICYGNFVNYVGPSASIGIAKTTTDYSVISNTTSLATPAVSTTAYNGSISDQPVSGTVFTWTPATPCTGTPVPGNTLASATSVCSGATSVLSLQNATSGSGVTYQWKSAADVSGSPGSYSNISGATSPTYIATVTATKWYKCDVICSGSTGTSAQVQVSLGTGAITSFPHTQNFDGVTAPALPCGWSIVNANGDASTWVNTSASRSGGSSPNQIKYTYNSASAANDWLFTPAIAMTAGNTYRLIFKYGAQSALFPEGMEVKYGSAATVAGMTSSAIFSNTSITNVTMASSGNIDIIAGSTGNFYIGFHAISAANEYYLFMDDVQIQEISGCTGTPTPGTVNTSAASGCAPLSPALSTSGTTSGPGIQYQWQSSPDNATWTSVSGATGTTYTPTLTATAYYRANITCTVSMLSAATPGVLLTVNASPSAITGTASICTGTTATLSATPAGGTWASSTAAVGTVNAGTGIVAGITAGTTNITYTITATGCNTVKMVTVYAYPSAVAITPAASATICLGSNTAFTAAATTTTTTNVLVQNFNSGAAGWTVDNTGSSGGMAAQPWQIQADGYTPGSSIAGTFHSSDNTPFAMTNADAGGSGSTTISKLISPVFSLAGYTTASLSFEQWYNYWSSGDATVALEISINGGTTYSTLQNYLGASQGTAGTTNVFAATTVSLAAYAGMSNLRLRYNYNTVWGYGWAVDNIVVGATAAPTYAWTGISGAAGLSCSACATTTITPTATGANVYSVTATANGCSTTNGVTVNVEMPTAVTVSGGGAACGGTVLTATGGTGGTIYYQGTTSGGTSTATAATTVSVTSSGTYYFRSKSAAGCWGTQGSATVTINAVPSAAPTNGGAICNGGTATLSAVPGANTSAYTWSGANIGTTTIQNTTATPTVTAVYSLTVSDGTGNPGCSPTTVYTTSVTVRARPGASPTNSSPICNGGTITLTANPGANTSTYAWSGPGFTSTSVNPTASPTVTTVYSLTVGDGTTASGCNPATVYTTSATVNSAPTAAPTNNGYICNGGTVTLSANGANGAATYSWAGSSFTSSATIAGPTATPTVTGTYSLIVTDGTGHSGCSPSTVYTTTVTVNNAPTAAPANNGYICSGGTVTLTANGANGAAAYSWTGASLLATTGATADAMPTATGIYSLTVTDGSTQPGCSPTTVYTTSVTVNSAPTAAPTNNGYICNGGTVTLAANGANGASAYSWAGSSFTSATTIAGPTATPASTSIYSLTVTDGSGQPGCSPATIYTTSVTVNSAPTAAPTNDGSICNGGTVNLAANGANGAGTYSWSGSALSSAALANVTAMPTATTIYSLTVTDGSTQPGCSPAAVYTTSVTVNNAPSLTGAINDGPACEGATLHLSANGAADVTGYSWAGPVALTGATTATPSVPAATTAATGIYTVTVNNAAGSGCTATYTTSATVNTIPTITSITPAFTTVCIGAPLTLNAGTPAGSGSLVSYNWSGLNGYTATSATGSTVFTVTTTAAGGVYSLSVTYTGTGCTSSTATSTAVTVNTLPAMVSMGASPATLCAGAVLSLTGNGASGVGSLTRYNWSGPGGYTSTTTGSTQTYTTPDASASGTYSVSVKYFGFGCTSVPVVSPAVTVNPLPQVHAITGGGFYCSGGSGVNIGLDGSETGISYQLYLGAGPSGAPVSGTGSALDFGARTASGTYSVVATNSTTFCTNNMSGTTTVAVGSVPGAYTVTGGGGYCSGGTGVNISLSSSDGSVVYQLYKDSVATGSLVSGTGSPLSFGLFTIPGNYTIIANPSATCAKGMNGSATVYINPLPNVYTVSGGGSYCAGGDGQHIVLDFSTTGVNYQLYNGATATGAPVAGSNSGLDFGLVTAAGTYTAVATNTTTSCVRNMSGSATITVNALPTAYTVTGGGSYCSGGSGVAVGLANSASGINYQLYNGSTAAGSTVAGTGSAISFGTFTAAGTYTVYATNTTTTCNNNMTGSAVISINPLPVAYAVTGGGSYCSGGTGVTVGLANSASGFTYQLYNGASTAGSSIAGTGSSLSFGLQAAAGTYTVLATNNATLCTNAMTGSATVTVNPLPTAYAITGGGTYCSGGSGVAIGLSNSTAGVNYQLYNGAAISGSAVAGTGSAISFGSRTVAGTAYSVVATDAATSCVNNMTGTASVAINPVPGAQTVTGGGSYCSGGSGVAVGLAGSVSGINYQLYNGAAATGSATAGTGAAISFGSQTTAGTYTVLATDAVNSCTTAMTGSATVIVNPLPTAYTVTGGGSYCSGGSGNTVGLSNSNAGISYQLYNGSATVGSPVAGTGSSFSFGAFTTSGTYSVRATNTATSCVNNMTGTATVVINPLPAAYIVGGGGNYCIGGSGLNINLSGSATGISYRLYRGSTAVGTALPGTGSPLNFGLQTVAGTYSVLATNTATSCTNGMTGTTFIIVNPLPVVQNVTGGGAYCAGGGGVAVGLDGSESGVNYQLYNGSSAFGGIVTGTGFALSFGTLTGAGSYTVSAVTGYGCTANMSGTATIGVNPLPAVFAVTGGGTYCSGGSGVTVGLSSSAAGITYQLYRGSTVTGSSLSGTGAALSFGMQSAAGTYTVRATNPATGCTAGMSGSSTISVNSLPAQFAVTGGGSYCSGGSGVNIGLSGSATGISYQLYNGAAAYSSAQMGTGGTINFGLVTPAGTYTVLATNTLTGCTAAMSGSTGITVNALPAIYGVSGGGGYCVGGAGVSVGLIGSNTGITYQLYRGAAVVGAPVTGTGSAISFGLQSAAGVYSVVATAAATGCTSNMSGTATVIVNSLPNVFGIAGGGAYCSGGTGVAITMAGTEAGVSYQLYNGSSASGGAVAGTGGSVSFGLRTAAGTYSAVATSTATGCSSNMSGSAFVSVNSLPTAYTVTGGGGYCNGAAGAVISLNGSTAGVNYTLYNGASAVATTAGTGAAISFAPQTAAATYSVAAANAATGCVAGMTGSAVIFVNPLPAAFAVTGGGSYCAGSTGVHVGIGGSATGVSYQLYNGAATTGAAIAGTGSALDFGIFTAAGTYSVSAVSSAGCTSNMTGATAIVVNSLPATYTVAGGGSYCAGGPGVNITLSGSDNGIAYQLYNGTTATGGTVAGNGSALDFGAQPAAGTYTISAANALTGCNSGMAGSANIVINPQPAAFTVAGGGSYCAGGAGFSVTLSGSAPGISYRLYNGATAIGTAVAGTGSALSFGTQSAAGTYTVLATDAATGCTRGMAGSAAISVNAAPTAYNVTGGGSYCAGGAGFHVGLSGSLNGISYQLYNGSTATGTALAGTGSPLDFGVLTAAGTYSVRATNTTSGCAGNMTGTAVINMNTLPQAYTVIGGGSYCAGGGGVVIYVSNSETGVNYQLYAGATPVGSAVAGNGGILGFGLTTTPGTYSVVATNASSACSTNMLGSASVVVNPLPVAYTITGGGSYCSGGAGVAIGLSGSNAGISYKLYRGTVVIGSAVAGTGGAISFGMQSSAGTYSVAATNATTGCTSAMGGSTAVIVNTAPAVYNVTGGGNYCTGGSGLSIGLNNSAAGVSYQLYNGAFATGSPVAGTGGALDFGIITAAGTYTVMATDAANACVSNMADAAQITVNPLPAAYAVTGGGSYCQGSAGVPVGLAASAAGVSYQLYNGASASGSAVAGTGSALSFGIKTAAGAYTVLATTIATGCTRAMTGSASVVMNTLPVSYTLSGGGNYCAGGAGLVLSLDGSSTGVNYNLYKGSSVVASAAGSGAAISFGTISAAGTYSVLAVNTANTCSTGMVGIQSVVVSPVPAVYAVNGGGNYCAGTPGVAVGVSGSATSVTYQLYRNGAAAGGALAGTGAALSFGTQPAGAYSVMATSATGSCSSNMSGTVTATLRALPAAYTVSTGGAYCAGSAGIDITLSGSDAGISYQLYNGSTATGSAKPGVNGMLDLGMQTAAGTYTVLATSTLYGCHSNMAGSAAVIVNALPLTQTVTGGGSYCAGAAGVSVGLLGSETGINYTVYTGAASGATVAGTGSSIDFGLQTSGGTYTVTAVNAATGCAAGMAGSANVGINALPAIQSIVAAGSAYCAGGAGVAISLSGSETGVTYQLYNGAALSGSAVAGTGSAFGFGSKTAAGTYSVSAINTATGCSSNMAGAAAISISPLPVAYTVTGGGTNCAGSAALHVGLSGSDAGISYQLYMGSATVGAPVAGTGTALDFGPQATSGTYAVLAVNTVTACTRTMAGSVVVATNPLPFAYAVTGGGSFCTGLPGVHVGLSGSATGISYQLYNGAAAVGSSKLGTGAAIDFGVYTEGGAYTIRAVNSTTSCMRTMPGSATIVVNSLPAVYTVTGGGNYCPGGSGVAVGISNADTGIHYQLYLGSTATGSAITGTGTAASFGLQTIPGTYTVRASSAAGCVRTMSGSSAVGISALPAVYNVTGGGSYCDGGTGTNVGLSLSATDVSYQLYHEGVAAGSPVAGTGGAISFGPQALAGSYTVAATGALTACTSNMSGSAAVSITPTVTPSVIIALSTNDTVCAGTHVTFGATAVNGGTAPAYQWKVNGVNAGVSIGSYSYVPVNGDVVSIALTSSVACPSPAVVTSSVVMTVQANQAPAVTIASSEGTSVCQGTAVTFTPSPVYGGTAPVYAWSKNGTFAATGSTYVATPDNNDVITCVMTSSFTCRSVNTAASNAVTMTVNQPTAPSVAITVNPGTNVAAGQDVQFTAVVANGGPAPAYQWLINGTQVAGATSSTYSTNQLANNDIVTCIVMSSGPCGGLPSFNTVTMFVSSVGVVNVAKADMDVRIIPNPNKGVFSVKGATGSKVGEEVSIEITDMLGQVVYSAKATARGGNIDEKVVLDNTLANGIYLLNLRTANGNKVFHVSVGQ